MIERSNDEWVSALSGPGPERDSALADLRTLLVRGLDYALAKYGNVGESDIQDFTQEALLKILNGLRSFRGESRFTTWAQKIAVHAAFTELRRRRWRDVSLDDVTMLPEGDFLPREWIDASAGTERQAIQREILDTLQDVIKNELTEKQRDAFVAVYLNGVPKAEVAEKMNSNPNALYKLLFDARKKLNERMSARGLSAADVLSAFES